MLACVYLSPTIPNLTWRVQAKSLIQSVNGAFLRSGVLCRQLEPRQEIDSHRVARGLHSLWWPRSCFGTWNSANLTSKIRQSPHHSKLDGRGLSQLRRVSLRKLSKPNLSHSKVHLRLCLSPLPKEVFKLPSLSDFQPPLLCRLFHPFGAQLNQSPEQPLRRHSTRSRAQMLKAIRKSFIKRTLRLSYFLSVSWRLACR